MLGLIPNHSCCSCRWSLLILLLFLCAVPSHAATPARLQAIETIPATSATQLRLVLDHYNGCTVTHPSDTRLRLRFSATTASRFKALQKLKDRHVSAVRVRELMGDTVVDIDSAGRDNGFRVTPMPEGALVRVDVGPQFKPVAGPRILPGRERLYQGAERLVREFDPPLKGLLPFVPSDLDVLKQSFPEREAKLVQLGEAALYKGRDTDAEAVFRRINPTTPAMRGLIAYRLGEALYGLQRYPEAIKSCEEGLRLWPGFLTASPTTAYSYADSLIRTGDYTRGRRELNRLISEWAGKAFIPVLMVRLGDVMAWQGEDRAAVNIYQAVKKLFPGTRGAVLAAMQLADRRIFKVSSGNYQELLREFRRIEESGIESDLREEALFKEALLESLYGPQVLALAKVSEYERKYPHGMFLATVRSMQEELLVMVVKEFMRAGDDAGLIPLAEQNRDCLGLVVNIPQFLTRLTNAYAAAGKLRSETELLSFMGERYAGTPNGPFLWERLLDDALKLGDAALAERAADRFVELYPRHSDTPLVREKLAAFKYQHNDLPAVVRELGWLLRARARASRPVSYYYLAKSLARAGRNREAIRMFKAYVGTGKGRGAAPYRIDAYYEWGGAALAVGDRKGALPPLRAGLADAPPELRPQFLFKLGQVELQLNHTAEARRYWEQVKTDKSDSDWQTLATQALADLDWQKELETQKRLLSK